MKKYLFTALALSALLSFSGCGGGSSSKNTNSGSQTGGTTTDTTTDTTTSTTLPTKDSKAIFTKDYLRGKTLYLASPDYKNVVSFVFGENSFSGEDVYRAMTNISYAITDKGYISFTEPDTSKVAYLKPISQDKDKISLAFSYDESSLANATKANKFFYFVKEKAVEYVKSIKTENPTTDDKSFKFSKEYLNRKTLYSVSEECDSQENGECTKSHWDMIVFTFTDSKMDSYVANNPSVKRTEAYTISSDGYIEYQDAEDKKNYVIKPVEKTADYISLIWEEKGSSRLDSDKAEDEFFYFDKAKAEAFLNSKNKK